MTRWDVQQKHLLLVGIQDGLHNQGLDRTEAALGRVE